MSGKFRRNVVIAVFCLTAATGLHAKTPSERLFEERWADHLPAWCLYTQMLPDKSFSANYGDPRSEEYERLFGSVWSAMHHYCFGLALTHEAWLTEDTVKRNFNFHSAVKEFDYVLDRSPEDFILKPELLVQKGAALEAVEDYIGAVTSYTDAIQLNSRYEPAYVGLSSCFEGLGDSRKALAIIDAGLRQVPDSEMLLVRREELTSLGSGGSD